MEKHRCKCCNKELDTNRLYCNNSCNKKQLRIDGKLLIIENIYNYHCKANEELVENGFLISKLNEVVDMNNKVELLENEIWKNVDVNGIYLISNKGRFYNNKKNILVSPNINKGYKRISIFNNNYFIHRLIGYSFIECDDINKNIINHLDGCKINNDCNNLEFCTLSENSIHAFENGLSSRDSVKKAIYLLDADEKPVKEYPSSHEAARDLCLNPGNIYGVLNGRLKHIGGYRFIYKQEFDNGVSPYRKAKKKVNQINECGEIIMTFESAASAANHFNISRQSISNICLGKQKATIDGLIFRFDDSDED